MLPLGINATSGHQCYLWASMLPLGINATSGHQCYLCTTMLPLGINATSGHQCYPWASMLPLGINATFGRVYHFDVIWCIEFYCPGEGYPQKKQNTGEEILQILSSLCYTSH
jgi:hypothetical protein